MVHFPGFCPIHSKVFGPFVSLQEVVIAVPHAKYYATENACIFLLSHTSQYYVGSTKESFPLQFFLTILTCLCLRGGLSTIVVQK